MVLQTSGPISLSQIQTEFGGSDPISMTEYYRNGTYVTSNNTSVPTTGAITLSSSFYGAVREFYLTLASNVQNANISTLATAAGWDGTAPLIVTINAGVWLWSDSVATAGLIIPSTSTSITIYNYGKIIGRGGNGSGGSSYAACVAGPGGPAISNAASSVSITNYSGGYIAGGGGGGGGAVQDPNSGTATWAGGGGGAGGGVGGSAYTNYNGINVAGGAAGAIGSSGANGGNSGRDDSRGLGGGSGGGAGDGDGGANAWHHGGLVADGDKMTYRNNTPIMAQEGEYIIPRDAVDYFGPDFFDMLRHEASPNSEYSLSDGERKTMAEQVSMRRALQGNVTNPHEPYTDRGKEYARTDKAKSMMEAMTR